MKYAAIVLRNITTETHSVEFAAVTDALLSGGAPLGELSLLPYNDPSAVADALARLRNCCDGVFLICDRVLLPSARDALTSLTGKACTGCLLDTEECLFAVLPSGARGAELVRESVIPALDERRRQSYYHIVLRTVCAPPCAVIEAVSKAQDASGESLSIHTSERYGAGRIEIVYNRNTSKIVADEAVRILASGLERYVYAMEDVDIGVRLFEALKLHRMKFSTAESFTGGGVCEAVVRNPGASKVVYEGIVAYDEEAKKDRLGVTEYTVKSKGVVSHEAAYEMAAGLLKAGRCDLAVATTGIAGPQSDLSGKPVGLCYIAVGTKERVRVFEFRLDGDREEITKTAVNLALFLAYKEIN